MNVSDDSRTLAQGVLVADYRIEGVLGQGAFGITYLATDTNLNVQVAIKEYFPREFSVRAGSNTVRPSGSKDDKDFFEWGRSRFLSEARTLARLSHPNIVSVRRLLEANHTAYLVMDYCDGRPLDQIIELDGPLSLDASNKLLWSVLDALDHVHRAGLIHRDVKPANIFIKANGSPVLLDFGAARHDVSQHSRSVTSLATAGYAPLEQYDTRGNQGPWSDIYGFAATLYRALTGERPPDAAGRVLGDTLVPISQRLAGKFDQAVLAAIDRGLAVLPADRPQTVNEWRALFGNSSNVPIPAENSLSAGGQKDSHVATPARGGDLTDGGGRLRLLLIGSTVTVAVLAVFYFYGGVNTSPSTQVESAKISPVVVPANPPELASRVDNGGAPSTSGGSSALTPKSDAAGVRQKEISDCPRGIPVDQWNDCKGEYVNEDGAKYIGVFKVGKLEGKGRLEHKGDVYVGGFQGGKYHGEGTYRWADGGSHSGRYVNGVSDGYGVMIWPSGARYEGGFKENLRHGRGRYKWPHGDVFEGNYVAGKREGFGKYTFKDGEVRENKYVDNEPTNPTTVKFTSGAKYVGDIDFKSLAYEGKGAYTYPDGTKYVGSFRNGKRDGVGVEYDSNGVVTRSGLWSENKFVSNATERVNPSHSPSTGRPAYAKPAAVIPARPQDASNMAMCNQWLSSSRAELPRKMDMVTTLVDYSCVQTTRGVVVVFKYNFDGIIRWNGESQGLYNNLRDGLVKNACNNDIQMALFDKLSFEHHYYDKNSKLGYVVPIHKSDCN